MNVKRIALKLGLVSLLAFGTSLQAAESSLRIGIEAAYPPFASKTPDNAIVGFDYDIGQALCAEMKVRCVWQEQEFDGLIPALKVKKVDAVISSMSITPERLKSVDFTDRYYRIPARLVFRKGSGINDIPAQLKGKRIGVQRATNFDRYVTDRFAPAGAEVVRYGSQNEIFLDLLGGRLDATMASSVVIDESLLKASRGQGFRVCRSQFHRGTILRHGHRHCGTQERYAGEPLQSGAGDHSRQRHSRPDSPEVL